MTRLFFDEEANTMFRLNYEDWKGQEGTKANFIRLVSQSEDEGTQTVLARSKKLKSCVVAKLSSVVWLPDPHWSRIADGMRVSIEARPIGSSTARIECSRIRRSF